MVLLKDEVKWKHLDRTKAIIITNDGRLYEDELNHQYCLLSFARDMFDGEDEDIEELIPVTDHEFRCGRLHGFDLYEDYAGKESYLISHYKIAYENESVKKIATEYAEDKGCLLAAFSDDTKLGSRAFLV